MCFKLKDGGIRLGVKCDLTLSYAHELIALKHLLTFTCGDSTSANIIHTRETKHGGVRVLKDFFNSEHQEKWRKVQNGFVVVFVINDWNVG